LTLPLKPKYQIDELPFIIFAFLNYFNFVPDGRYYPATLFLVRGMGKEQTIFDALWQFCCKKEEVFSVIE
jgi:hypothetical protein